jgi:anaerobic dimethyl sulfoxide reductase subunit A
MNESEERVVYTSCASHCGGTCVLKCYVKDGVITKIETDDGEEPQLRACLKGRAYRQRVYDPNRLKFPMKRVGARGEGKFERITWDEALDTVAKELIRTKETYGPQSILYLYRCGEMSQVHNPQPMHRLLSLNGGYSRVWGVPSFQGGIGASLAHYGTVRTDNSRDDLLNSRLIILWGWNPASSVTGTNSCWYLAQAREAGAKIIAVDPRFTTTAGIFADQWIPIRPGTDAAMQIAMAYTIIKERLQDQAFLDKYTIGFDRFKDYVLGVEDGQAKTPLWAEEITGVPASTIEALARDYATTKPAALMTGIAAGRTAYGEQYHRAGMTLAAMTGNVGIHGGHAGGRCWESGPWYPFKMRYGLTFRPVHGKEVLGEETRKGGSTAYIPSEVHHIYVPDMIFKGKAGGYPADIKIGIIVNTNYANQYANLTYIEKALLKLEFIVVLEQVMTPTAKFADILLPTTTFLERNDINHGTGTPYYGFANKVIEPVEESKSHLDIARELAEHMGIDYGDEQTEDQLIERNIAESEIPDDYEAYRKRGKYVLPHSEPYISFKKEIEDPDNNPFPTPSGKIEIYSQKWAERNDPEIPVVPKYLETWESRNDPLAEKYPLQLITTHFKRRTHGQYETIPWLRELEEQAMLINTADAEARGIINGEKVRVFNDRGEIVIKANVTERIIPGVVDVPQGAWFNPGEQEMDRKTTGNPNFLTKNQPSPMGAFTFNTSLVEVEKFQNRS